MERFAEALSAIGALMLSVACGVLVEELLFGGLVRFFFASRPGTSAKAKRNEEGERTCLR